jgi:hypothetical protein
MNLQIFSQWRPLALMLGLLAGMSLPAAASPLAAIPDRGTLLPTVSEGRTDVTPVHSTNPRWKKKRNYRRDRRYDRRYDRRHDRRYHRRIYPRLYLPPVYPNYRYVEPRRYNHGSRHVRWCYNRYRSYRAWDNTFQPYHGPRRQCRSPYWP